MIGGEMGLRAVNGEGGVRRAMHVVASERVRHETAVLEARGVKALKDVPACLCKGCRGVHVAFRG
jgi:hypothetical protein